MTKAIVLAAAYIGHGIGYRVHDYDLEEHVTDLVPFGAKYAGLAVALVDAAKMVVFVDPEDLYMQVYEMFGDAITEYFNDNDNELPHTEWCHHRLVELVYNQFVNECSQTQKDALKRALDAEIKAQ